VTTVLTISDSEDEDAAEGDDAVVRTVRKRLQAKDEFNADTDSEDVAGPADTAPKPWGRQGVN
jgi:hypothetical protein